MFNDNPSDELSPEAPMSCDIARRIMGDMHLSEAVRLEVLAGAAHVESCEACREAMNDYDKMQALLGNSATGLTEGEPRGGWDVYEERLRSALARSTAARSHVLRFMRPLSAVAAGVLLVVGGFVWGSRRGPILVAHADPGQTVLLAPLSKSEVAHQMRAFGEVDQVFEGRMRWLLLKGGESDVSLENSEAKPVGQSKQKGPEQIVLLRLDLSRGGQVVSTADVLIVAGESAEVRLPMKDGTSLRYRLATSGLDPSQLTLRAELRASGGSEAQASLATNMQLQPDRGTSAGELIAPSGRYDVKVLYASASSDGPGFRP